MIYMLRVHKVDFSSDSAILYQVHMACRRKGRAGTYPGSASVSHSYIVAVQSASCRNIPSSLRYGKPGERGSPPDPAWVHQPLNREMNASAWRACAAFKRTTTRDCATRQDTPKERGEGNEEQEGGYREMR